MSADLELLARWRDGDETAGEQLFARHFDDVYRFFRNKCAQEADDLVQRTFLACVASRDQFRSKSTFRTYLFAIARNELYGHLRRCKRNDGRLDFSVTSIGELITTPATRMARDRAAQSVRDELRNLPVDQQMILELRYWHELAVPALAEIFEAPPETVRTRLFRARAALRKKLRKLGSDFEDLERLARFARPRSP